jgi:folate-binding protein YgfZ
MMMNGYQALRNSAAWIDLSHRGKIRVSGEDRARLLHAMCTNHVEELAPGAGLYAFFLNDKGRILADSFIYNLGESLFLDTEPEARIKLFEHLDHYIFADDVTLEDESESTTAIGLEGPRSLDIAAQASIPVAAEFGVKPYGDGFTVRVSSTGADGLRIFLSTAQRSELVDRLQSAGAIAATAEEARVVRLEHGIPRYGEEISERYLVQETQVTRAVHPNKGCYLGQEIVERVRSQGQVRRLLTPVRIASQTPPASGTKLMSSGAEIAEISSAAYSPALHQVVGMAYVRIEAIQAKAGLVVAHSEPPVSVSLA